MKSNYLLEPSKLQLGIYALAAGAVLSATGTMAEPKSTEATKKTTTAKMTSVRLTGPRYDIIDLGSLRGGGEVNATALNNKGQVCGYAPGTGGPRGGAWHPFIWEKGKMKDLGRVSGSFEGRAQAINEKGEVFGYVVYTKGSANSQRNFKWSQGKLTLIDTYPAARSSNNKGEKLARVRTGGVIEPRNAVFLGDRFVKLPEEFVHTTALNDKGQVVGSSSLAATGKPANAAVSSRGSGRNRKPLFACLWSGGKLQSLGTLPGTTDSHAVDINEAGQVVGNTSKVDRDLIKGGAPFLWQSGRMQNLNELLPPKSNWVLGRAVAINDNGQIIGMGSHNGVGRAFLLTWVK